MLIQLAVMSALLNGDAAPERWNLLEDPRLPEFEAIAPSLEPQVVNPADKMRQGQDNKMVERQQEVRITAGLLKEEGAVGPTNQPEWTQHRRWGNTRVYVQQPPGGVEFEQWIEIRMKRDAAEPVEFRISQEFEFGIFERMQLDIYMRSTYMVHSANTPPNTEAENMFAWRGMSVELRYALADWDVIFGNPTIYLEYTLLNGEADVIEVKLLFGGAIQSGWYWGTNFVFETGVGPTSQIEVEYKITLGLSHTVIDQVLSIGIAGEVAYVETPSPEHEFHIGPSIQIRPIPRMHLDIEPLFGIFGLGRDSKRLKMYIVFGWDF